MHTTPNQNALSFDAQPEEGEVFFSVIVVFDFQKKWSKFSWVQKPFLVADHIVTFSK